MTALPPPARPRRFRTIRSVAALMVREMVTTYGRSPGGYVWAVLEPVGAIVVLTFAFSLVLRSPSLGTDFALFYATGYLPLSTYLTVSNTVSRSLRFSRALLAYPSVTFVDAILGRFLLNLLTKVMVFYVIVNGIVIINDLRPIVEFHAIVQSFAMIACIAVGIGVMNAYLMAMLPVWEHVWGIATRPLFLASCVFYILEDLPRAAQEVLWYNPIVHAVGVMRRAFYPTYEAPYVSFAYVFGLGLGLTAMGLALLFRAHRTILHER